MASLPADFWETRFQAKTTPWEREGLHPSFLAWRESGALPPCRIVIPGAGRSPEPQALLQDGFDVVALDLADSAIADQQTRIGPARVIQADVTTWEPDELFDAAYDQTCLCALPPDLWPAYVRQLGHWVRSGGRLFILFMQITRPGGPPFNCSIPDMRTLFADWTWPDTLPPGIPHRLGGDEVPAVLTRR